MRFDWQVGKSFGHKVGRGAPKGPIAFKAFRYSDLRFSTCTYFALPVKTVEHDGTLSV